MKQLGRNAFWVLPLLGALVLPVNASEFWVSPNGDDRNTGTQESPVASVTRALRQARELRRLNQVPTNEAVRIVLRGGNHQLIRPLFVRPEDSGTASSPTVIEAAPGEKPVLSGDVPLTGWRALKEKIPGLLPAVRGKIWMADAPKFGGRVLEIRQLWVNEGKAIRAREPNGDNLNRLLAWDRQQEEAWIPAALVKSLQSVLRVEMVIHQQWEIAVCRLNAIRVEGEKACVTYQQPESKIQFEHPWPQPVMSTNGNAPFFLANAIEFLDEPGEWFQELPSGKIYYWPRAGENLNTTQVIAPVLETLVKVEG